MRTAFIVIIWIAVGGLFVSASLLLRKTGNREALTNSVLGETPHEARPNVDPRHLPFTDEWREPSVEDMKKLASKWAIYSSDLEIKYKIAQLALQSQATQAHRGRRLFWIALAFLAALVLAPWLVAPKHQPPESVSADLSGQAKLET